MRLQLHKLIKILLLGTLTLTSWLNSNVFAKDMNPAVIDNRNNTNLTSALGTKWQLVTDTVMGGLSKGQLSLDEYKGKSCLRMRGNVTTENNGGFVQIALPLSKNNTFDASQYSGVEIEVAGNSEIYNIHIRTDELWFPWQSYRSSFKAESDWKKYRFPFQKLDKYKTLHEFSPEQINRIGLVAIGREFQADLCLTDIRFYND